MVLALLLLGLTPQEVPAIVRVSPHFSGAIGSSNLAVIAKAEHTSLTLGDGIPYSISIENVRNPSDVRRPVLEFAGFGIETNAVTVEPNAVTFHYRLRPREAGTVEIPSVRIDYFMPEAAEGKQLRTKYTETIPITVTAKAENAPAFTVPMRFQTLREEQHRWWQRWNSVDWSAPWRIVLLVAAGSVVLYVLVWRWRNPQGVRLARLTRSRAVRRALAHIDADPVAAFRQYLHARFAIESGYTTPSEIGQRLLDLNVDSSLRAEVDSLLRDADAQRFAESPVGDLPQRARDAILRLEGSAWTR